MANVHRSIARLLHRPQHEERNRPLFRLVVNTLEQLLEVPWPQRGELCAEAVAEPGDELLELRDFHEIRLLMNPVERGHATAVEP